jgi:hypothetical protein
MRVARLQQSTACVSCGCTIAMAMPAMAATAAPAVQIGPGMVIADVVHAGEAEAPEYTVIARKNRVLFTCRQDFHPAPFPPSPQKVTAADLWESMANDTAGIASCVCGAVPRHKCSAYLAYCPDQAPVISAAPGVAVSSLRPATKALA